MPGPAEGLGIAATGYGLPVQIPFAGRARVEVDGFAVWRPGRAVGQFVSMRHWITNASLEILDPDQSLLGVGENLERDPIAVRRYRHVPVAIRRTQCPGDPAGVIQN